MLPFVAAARLVGSYNQVVRDLGRNNLIVVKLEAAAKKADIKDPKVPVGGNDPHVQVLQHWSTVILDDFETKNNAQLVSQDPNVNSLLQQLVAQNEDMRSRLVRVEDKMHDVVSTSDLREQLAMEDRDILRLKTELLQSKAKNMFTGSKRNCWLRICNILQRKSGITRLGRKIIYRLNANGSGS